MSTGGVLQKVNSLIKISTQQPFVLALLYVSLIEKYGSLLSNG